MSDGPAEQPKTKSSHSQDPLARPPGVERLDRGDHPAAGTFVNEPLKTPMDGEKVMAAAARSSRWQ